MMSNVKPKTKEDILAEKKATWINMQYKLSDVLVRLPIEEAKKSIVEYVSILTKLHSDPTLSIAQSKTPHEFADQHNNNVKSHIRKEGDNLVFSSIITTEHGEKKHFLIRSSPGGNVEIYQDKENVEQIFKNPEVDDVSKFTMKELIHDRLPVGIGIIETPSAQMTREEVINIKELFLDN